VGASRRTSFSSEGPTSQAKPSTVMKALNSALRLFRGNQRRKRSGACSGRAGGWVKVWGGTAWRKGGKSNSNSSAFWAKVAGCDADAALHPPLLLYLLL
jgi:hypothetical protein